MMGQNCLGKVFYAVLICALCSACGESTQGSFESGKMYEDASDIMAPETTIKDALINGTVTRDRTEIGRTIVGGGSCTGTLISPQVMVSARHCLNYTTCDDSNCVDSWGGGVAIFEDALGQQHRFDIERWTSFAKFGRLDEGLVARQIDYLNLRREDYWTSDDVALIRLKQPVPSSIAQPSTLATQKPSVGDPLSVWGYGCTQRITRSDGSKRYRDFSEGIGRSDNLCPGDSGGPVTLGRQGEVLYVNSAFATTSDGQSRDVFGDILFFDDLIRAELAAWGEQIEQPKEPMNPIDPDPMNPVDPEPMEPEEPEEPMQPEQPEEPEQPAPFQPGPSDDIISSLNVPIGFEDGSSFGLAVTLESPGTYAELQIDMELHHDRPEEIMLVLHMPNGVRMVLQEAWRNPSVYRSYIIPNFDNIDVRGDWVLEFHDVARGNSGELRNLKFTWVRE